MPQPPTKCDGMKNIAQDLTYITLAMSGFSAYVGFLSEIGISKFVDLFTGAISGINFPGVLPPWVGTIWTILSKIFITIPFASGMMPVSLNTLIMDGLAFFFKNMTTLNTIVFLVLDSIEFALSILSAFPKIMEEFLNIAGIFGVERMFSEVLENYGCSNKGGF